MAKFRILSASEQVAERLRVDIRRGTWSHKMPGEHRLVAELGTSHDTVKEALRKLEKEGLLLNQGPGKKRLISLDGNASPATSLHVQILLYEKGDSKLGLVLELLHGLHVAGYQVAFAEKTLMGLGMDVKRVARFVENTAADAWIIIAGSRDVLDWFVAHPTPAFALFGRLVNVRLASTSPKKAEVYTEVVDRLVELGHTRIVHLVREERRKPAPGLLERLFLERLEKHGIQAGAYNLPDWEESPASLYALMESLFQHTPPTAMLIDGSVLYHAVRSYLSNHRIIVPDQISLICTDPDPSFEWCLPTVTHMDWDSRAMIQRVFKWADNISRGKDDRRKTSQKAHLVTGGTIGPAPEG